MLSPDYLLHISEGAEEIAAGLHTRMLQQVISRILARESKGYDYILTAADKWRLQSVMEAGYLRDDLIQEIAEATKYQEEEIAAAFEDAGIKALDYDDKIYRKAGLSPKPLKESPYMIRIMQRNYEATLHEWNNYTRTTADASQEIFIQTMDDIYNDVMMGGTGYVKAYTDAIDKLATTGLLIHYPTGHRDTIETAALRCVRTGVSQASAQIQIARMNEMDVDLVLVSSHMGARPSHQVWQGKVYSRSGKDKKYPDFVSSTGYGTGPGLCGWNCRHNFSPYFEGMGNPFERYNDEENTELYELTQKQRSMERAIRKQKRKNEALKNATENATDAEMTTALRDKARKSSQRLAQQRKAYNEFCAENNLRPLPERLRIGKANRQS